MMGQLSYDVTVTYLTSSQLDVIFFFSREAIEKTLLNGSQILFVFVRGCNNLPERKKCFFSIIFLTFQQQ